MSILTSAREGLAKIKNEWNTPAPGNYVSYKEIVALGAGGMGPEFSGSLSGRMSLSADADLMGQALGLRPMDMTYVSNIQKFVDIFLYALRAKIVDNTRTKWGRFRPYIATIGFLLTAISMIFVYLPFDSMTYSATFLAAIIVASTASIIRPLYTDTHSELVTVITPNSEERTKIIAIYQFMMSLAPTLTGAFVPVLMNNYGRFTDIDGYRKILVPIAVAGTCFSLITAFMCKERVITPKSYVQKVGVFKGAFEIYQNRYWLCRQVAGWIGFTEGFFNTVISWYFIYSLQDTRLQGIANTVLGTAYNVGFILCPILLKRIGNRNTILLNNSLNIVFIILMCFSFKNPVLMICLIWMNLAVDSLAFVYGPALHSDTKDYQQYVSGRRMDFTFGIASTFAFPLTMLTNMFKPWVYERVGLTSNYDLMYDTAIRNNLFAMLCIFAVIGSVLNLLPNFFYTLSRQRHRNIIRVLRYRALFGDYADGKLEPETIVEAVDNHRRVMEIQEAPAPDFAALKAELARAKALPKPERAEAVNKARDAYYDAKDLAEEKKEIHYYLEEVEKFVSPETKRRIADAKKLQSIGLHGLKDIDDGAIQAALALPKGTKEGRKIRSAELRYAQSLVKMARAIPKAYPNGIEVPDESEWERATALPEDTKEQRKAKDAAVRAAEKKLQVYHSTLEPWIEAEKLLEHAEISDTIFGEVEAMYDGAKSELDRKYAEQLEKAQRESEEKEIKKRMGKR